MWADRFDRRTIKDFHEFMNNINVQEDRSASTITRDVPPIMEMKSKRCRQLQSYTTCHTVVHKCNSSPPHTSQWTELEIGTTEWAPALGIDLSNSRISLITDIFGSISANHARCSIIAHGDTLSGFSKYTRMSWIHPYNCLFTSSVSTSLTKL